MSSQSVEIPLILNPYRTELESGDVVELNYNPQPIHFKILNEIFRPEPEAQKIIVALCGISVGKTTMGVLACEGLMEKYPGFKIMFLEPDADRINTVFMAEWERWVPKALYTVKTVNNQKEIHWHNGSICLLRHRWTTGNAERSANRARGINLNAIISDEEAIDYNHEFFQNCMGRLRLFGDVSTYVALTTPQVGPFAQLLDVKGVRIIHARTADNSANLRPGFEADERSRMSEKHARRELDGEMVALEGSVWECFREDLNVCNDVFDRDRPYILGGDIGVQSSWLIMQKSPRGYLACVGEYHPDFGGTKQDVSYIFSKWGRPSKIIAGRDMNTDSVAASDSSTIELLRELAKRGFDTRVQIITPTDIDPSYRDKFIQYSACTDAMEMGKFKISRACIPDKHGRMPGVHGNNRRSLHRMFQQDVWPKSGAATLFLKDKRKGAGLEDVRDCFFYTMTVEFPPRIGARAA